MRYAVDEFDLSDLKPWKAPPAPRATDPAFWENVERWEAASWNRSGTEKVWVDRLHEDWAAMVHSFVQDRPALSGRGRLIRELQHAQIRYLVIGVGGADIHAEKVGERFHTKDFDLFLPRDPANLLACWQACERARFELWSGREPLDSPRDLWLARQVVEGSALTRAQADDALPTDLTFVMGRLDFEDVWLRRTWGYPDGVGAELARMSDIVESKRQADREKDREFLARHRAIIDRILADEGPPAATS
ncbi:MAG: hypothetical protein NTY35_14520 [Planctomycetota bacterium]|nr:hypothetical protein [Planctomycetota bacterium]